MRVRHEAHCHKANNKFKLHRSKAAPPTAPYFRTRYAVLQRKVLSTLAEQEWHSYGESSGGGGERQARRLLAEKKAPLCKTLEA